MNYGCPIGTYSAAGLERSWEEREFIDKITRTPARLSAGETARTKRLAKTFSADAPDSLVLFPGQYPDLLVQTDAVDYVVKDR